MNTNNPVARHALLLFAFLLGIVVFTSCSGSKGEDPDYDKGRIPLRLNLKTGDTFDYKLKMSSEISQLNFMGRRQGYESEIGVHYKFRVQAIEGDTLIMDVRYHAMKFNIATPNDTMIYDSQKPGESNFPELGALVSMLQEQPLTMHVAPDGTVGTFEGMEAIEKLSMELLQTDVLAKNLKEVFGYLPEKKIKEQDKWEPRSSFSSNSRLDVLRPEITVEKITEDMVVLNAGAKYKGKELKGVMGSELKIDGTTRGELLVDRATGLPLHGSIDLHATARPADKDMEMFAKDMRIRSYYDIKGLEE